MMTKVLYAFFFIVPSTSESYTLSLHDALPISGWGRRAGEGSARPCRPRARRRARTDRKSTRLNSSHTVSSYAVFCLKKKIRARSKEEEDKLWDVRRAISQSMMKYGTLKINEDVVVPRSKVPELVSRIEEIGKKHNTFVANFGHAGDGNIHVNFVVDREDADAIARARQCVSETFALSIALGGTISGEHGIGYVKAPYLNYAVDRPTLE